MPGSDFSPDPPPPADRSSEPQPSREAAGADDSIEPRRRVIRFTYEGENARLDRVLSGQISEYSRSFIQRLISSGYVNFEPPAGIKLKASSQVRAPQNIRIVIPPPIRMEIHAENIPLEIIYQDDQLAVINKPAGLTVHPAPDQMGSTLVNALLYWLDDLSGIGGVERPGIVHRLDKDTSGVMVVAKTDEAHNGLSLQFKERLVKKTYQAIVRGQPEYWEGRLDFPIGRSRTHSKKMVVVSPGEGREALTDYRVLEKFDGYSLVECYPRSGRTHQIRVHLGKIRLPIAADRLYGREKSIHLSDLQRKRSPPGEKPIIERQALHAAGIRFMHPTERREMTFSAPLHQDMLDLLHALQRYRSPR